MSAPATPSPDDTAAVGQAPFAAPTLEQLTGLVFELASQLHVERVRRVALEAALDASGLLAPHAVEHAAARPEARSRTGAALDRAMAGVMRVLTEDADPRAPLRAQASASAQAASAQADPT